jgi:ParB-like chromosome segregation protein Spo0J
METLAIDKIVLHPKNAEIYRKSNPGDGPDDDEVLRASIEANGIVEPLVVNKRTGRLISGHRRYHGAKALGLTEVPVRYLDLDDLDELQALVDSNVQRTKTEGNRAAEYRCRREIEKQKAEKRKAEGQALGGKVHREDEKLLGVNVDTKQLRSASKSKARDLAAAAVGWSGGKAAQFDYVARHAPELLDQVFDDVLGVHQAYAKVQEAQKPKVEAPGERKLEGVNVDTVQLGSGKVPEDSPMVQKEPEETPQDNAQDTGPAPGAKPEVPALTYQQKAKAIGRQGIEEVFDLVGSGLDLDTLYEVAQRPEDQQRAFVQGLREREVEMKEPEPREPEAPAVSTESKAVETTEPTAGPWSCSTKGIALSRGAVAWALDHGCFAYLIRPDGGVTIRCPCGKTHEDPVEEDV